MKSQLKTLQDKANKEFDTFFYEMTYDIMNNAKGKSIAKFYKDTKKLVNHWLEVSYCEGQRDALDYVNDENIKKVLKPKV